MIEESPSNTDSEKEERKREQRDRERKIARRMNYWSDDSDFEIKQFIGEPNLKKYFKGFKIDVKYFVSRYEICSKKMKKICSEDVPPTCYLYHLQYGVYRFSECQICKGEIIFSLWDKTEFQQVLKADPRKFNIQSLPKSSVLCVVQTVAYMTINFSEFSSIFKDSLLWFKKNFFDLNSEPYMNQLCMNFNSNINIRQQSKTSNRKTKEIDFYEISGFSLKEFSLIIFKQLCFEEDQEYILWPCLILQPYKGEKSQLAKILEEMTEEGSLECQKDFVFKYTIEMIQANKRKVKKDSQYVRFKPSYQIKNKVRRNQQRTFRKSFVKLLGCHQTVHASNKLLIHFSKFSSNQHEIIMSPFPEVIPSLNHIIEELNVFKHLQYSLPQKGNYIGRVCKYLMKNGKKIICIALNSQYYPKKQSQVLVRSLEEDKYFWVDQQNLEVNLTLPLYSRPDQLTKIALELTQQELIQKIYNDTYDNKDQVFFSRYSQEENPEVISEVDITQPKCQKCKLSIINFLPQANCKACHHQDQQSEKKSLSSCSSNNIFYCKLCSMITKNNSYKCVVCYKQYHWFCIRQYSKAKLYSNEFLCDDCLHGNPPGEGGPTKINNQEVLCSACEYHPFNQRNICQFCWSCTCLQEDNEIFSCSTNSCRNRIHRNCDPALPSVSSGPSRLKFEYYCPICRVILKRKLLKWIIDDLSVFDQFQFFSEPSYHAIEGYLQQIKHPMCTVVMIEKLLEGKYDQDPFTKILQDFQLIIKNALTFNFHNTNPYYRAKIYYILGLKYLDHFKSLIKISQTELLTTDLYYIFKTNLDVFTKMVHQNYLSLLLNFQHQNSQVEIQTPSVNPKKVYGFNSREILLKQLDSNSTIKFKLKLEKQSVEKLLQCPKNKKGSLAEGATKVCYLHPKDKFPIIYQCQQCWEYYCCTYHCPKHNVCRNCPPSSCKCENDIQCNCFVKSSDEVKDRVAEEASRLNLTIEQITQYYKYCFTCTLANLDKNLCQYCQGFCYYGYQQCKKCQVRYHLPCLYDRTKTTFLKEIITEDMPLDTFSLLDHTCLNCFEQQENFSQFVSSFKESVQTSSKHASKCRKYLPIISFLLKAQGFNLSPEKILFNLLHACRKQFNECLSFLEEISQEKNIVEELIKIENLQDKEEYQRNIEYYDIVNFGKSYLEEAKDEENIDKQRIQLRRSIRQFIRNSSQNHQEQVLYGLEQPNLQQILVPKRPENIINIIDFPENHGQSMSQPLKVSAHQVPSGIMKKTSNLRMKLNYLKKTFLSLFQEKLLYLKQGNTCILESSQTDWKCIKYFRSYQYIFELQKQDEKWHFGINSTKTEVHSVSDILQHMAKFNPHITKREQLIDFLGLNVQTETKTKRHFSLALERSQLTDLGRRESKELIQSLEKENQQQLKEEVLLKMKSKVIHKNIYYLKKRTKAPENQSNRLNVKITLEELKRDITMAHFQGQLQDKDENLILNDPSKEDILYLAPSKIDRLGLYTKEAIPKFTIVLEYIGELISEKIADLRQKKYRFGCYMFSLANSQDRLAIVDATFQGNMARYLNHSCNANCKAKQIIRQGQPVLLIYTIRNILKYEELTYDYRFQKDGKEILECKCKADNCLTILN